MDKITKTYLKMIKEAVNDDTTSSPEQPNQNTTKSYEISYMSGNRDYTKIVETNDIEAYIKKNYQLVPSSIKRLNKKIFLSAKEIEKIGNVWYYVSRGEYYFGKMSDLFTVELTKSVGLEYHDRKVKIR